MLVATLAMTDDTILPFSFPAVSRKKITAAFDGGRLTSNGGVMLLAMADRRIGVAEKLSLVFPERRDATRIVHSLADMIRARMFAIACGYEDSDDLDHLRADPAFKLACGRLPDTDRDLCSQPTLSRLENAPRLREVIRLTYALVDLWMDSYTRVPSAVTLDIDDTVDVVHGYQQLSLFNATNAASCRSTSTTPSAADRSPSSCVPARRRAASRCAPICAASSGASAGAGRRPTSPSEAMVITLGPRR